MDTVFIERYTEEMINKIKGFVVLYPENAIAIAWKQVLQDGVEDLETLLETADQIFYETDQVSLADETELTQAGFSF